jgi:dihydroxyacetone kinase
MIVIKLIGAASQKGWAFERCRQIGELGNSQLVTIGTSLDHCHVPGRDAFEQVPEDACVLGMGIHNEPVCNTNEGAPFSANLIRVSAQYHQCHPSKTLSKICSNTSPTQTTPTVHS